MLIRKKLSNFVFANNHIVKQLIMNWNKVTNFLDSATIESIAWSSKFYKRKPKKITATNFLISFFIVLSKGAFSFRIWSSELSILTNQKVSFQSIAKKLGQRHLDFAKMIFVEAIRKNIRYKMPEQSNNIFNNFSRVVIEDSTCVKLAKNLFHHFSGTHNGRSRFGTVGRIQFAFDLKKGRLINGELTTYSQNDVSYSKNIINSLRKGDLVIRDLGYFSIGVFMSIANKNAWFLSRLRNGTFTYELNSEKSFDLVKELKKLDRLKITDFDKVLLLNKKYKMKGRIVAQKLSKKQTKKRIEHVNKTRRRCNTTKKSRYLMSWSIYVTNVPKEIWSIQNIHEAYSFRWEIEMMFKTWKSHFKIDKFIQNFKQSDPIKPEIILMLCLSFLAIVYKPQFNYYYTKLLKRDGVHLSPSKFAQFLKAHFYYFFNGSKNIIIDLLRRFCCYDKRADRKNIYQRLYAY